MTLNLLRSTSILQSQVYADTELFFYIKATDIDLVARKVTEAGGVLKSEVFDNKWNARELLVEDPNGYKFAFYQK